MRKSAPPLMAIFRSRLQAEVLAAIYLRVWDTPVSISGLARDLGEPVSSVHREVQRLVEAGLLDEVKTGRTRLISRPDDDLIARALTELLAVSFGPLPVLTDLLAEVSDIDEAYIYGSWAARYRGENGPVPNDVDVIVVGDADLDALDEVAEVAGKRLRREINIRRVSRQRWDQPENDPFLRNVRDRPLVELVLAGREEIT